MSRFDPSLLRAQRYAFDKGLTDGRQGRVDGWANHSPSYRAGQAMARVEVALTSPKDVKGGGR